MTSQRPGKRPRPERVRNLVRGEQGPSVPRSESPRSVPADSAKLNHARVLLEQLRLKVGAWIEGGQAIKSTVGVGMASLEFPSAPVELSLLVGDCLQNLRSALDHEVYRMTAAQLGRLSRRAADCAFPIYEDEGRFNSDRNRLVGSLSAPAQDFIRSVQPFASPTAEAAEGLRLLNRLARIDRHRILTISAAQPKSISIGPPVMVAGGQGYAPVTLDMELRFVDPDFLGLNTLTTLDNATNAVASTIEGLRALA